jgi:hypothetical protein
MSNLIPQRRADKTGKVVTRHVRAEPKSLSGRSSIPKPALTAPVPQVDDIDKPFALGPFNWRGNNKVIDALHKQYNRDESQQVEMTSREWLAARREGLYDQQIHYFLLAGITDPAEMREFAQQYDKSLSPKIRPGLHAKREAWIDNLTEAGITKAEFDAANKNFGSYGIVTALNDFDRKDAPADTVRMYAEFPSAPTRQALNEFLFDGRMTLDQLKEIGVTRVRKYGEIIKPHAGTVDAGDIARIIKHEEKASSLFGPKAQSRIRSRLSAAELWGADRAMELREPSPLTQAGYDLGSALREMKDNGFEFAKFHDDVLRESILTGSQAGPNNRWVANFSEHEEYAHITETSFYNPPPEKTIDYFRAGLTPEETIKGLEDGLSAISARGIKEGATPAVASGWL